jgi:integrase
VDLENSRLSVRRTFTEGRILLGEPKTKKSRRTIRLTKAAIRALRWHLARQIGYVECLGDLYRDQGLVFASEVGSPMNPTNLRRRSFAALLGRANLPRIRFHDLRHAPALQERQPEDRLRDAWARVNQHHPGHLLAHAP